MGQQNPSLGHRSRKSCGALGKGLGVWLPPCSFLLPRGPAVQAGSGVWPTTCVPPAALGGHQTVPESARHRSRDGAAESGLAVPGRSTAVLRREVKHRLH